MLNIGVNTSRVTKSLSMPCSKVKMLYFTNFWLYEDWIKIEWVFHNTCMWFYCIFVWNIDRSVFWFCAKSKLAHQTCNQSGMRKGQFNEINLSHWLTLVQRADNPGYSVLSNELPVSSNEIYNRYLSHCIQVAWHRRTNVYSNRSIKNFRYGLYYGDFLPIM